MPKDNFINSLQNGSFVYDIGCGNGRNMHFDKHTFIGIDNCEKFIEICREKKLLVQLADMRKINLPDPLPPPPAFKLPATS